MPARVPPAPTPRVLADVGDRLNDLVGVGLLHSGKLLQPGGLSPWIVVGIVVGGDGLDKHQLRRSTRQRPLHSPQGRPNSPRSGADSTLSLQSGPSLGIQHTRSVTP